MPAVHQRAAAVLAVPRYPPTPKNNLAAPVETAGSGARLPIQTQEATTDPRPKTRVTAS